MSDLHLLFRFINASIRSQAQYPGSAILLVMGNFLNTAIEIVATWALFDRFGAVRGWTFGEVALFYGLVNIMFAIADVLTRGFDLLGTTFLRTGSFDRLLLRPRSVTLQLMGHDFRVSRFGRLLQGIFMLAIGTQLADVMWSADTIAVALWAVAGGVALFVGILVLQGALSFWTIESLEVAHVLSFGGVQAAQYPLSIYNEWLRDFLTFVVPLACVVYFPVLTILSRHDPLGSHGWLGFVTPIAGFVFLGVAFVAWHLGIRHYTSTGS